MSFNSRASKVTEITSEPNTPDYPQTQDDPVQTRTIYELLSAKKGKPNPVFDRGSAGQGECPMLENGNLGFEPSEALGQRIGTPHGFTCAIIKPPKPRTVASNSTAKIKLLLDNQPTFTSPLISTVSIITTMPHLSTEPNIPIERAIKENEEHYVPGPFFKAENAMYAKNVYNIFKSTYTTSSSPSKAVSFEIPTKGEEGKVGRSPSPFNTYINQKAAHTNRLIPFSPSQNFGPGGTPEYIASDYEESALEPGRWFHYTQAVLGEKKPYIYDRYLDERGLIDWDSVPVFEKTNTKKRDRNGNGGGGKRKLPRLFYVHPRLLDERGHVDPVRRRFFLRREDALKDAGMDDTMLDNDI
ncbi:hypothetical protein MKZ38_006682 [Zalerion maritima]|uniref:Uncharacterized protein n=1 Tax=Zalerion maritima TaxID=339359 RepID=A0AAD5WW86_9PEZI|nr:hypothetical protein MKZ38_006682 [Zalerion maritima]